jgi:hypothetical protein
MKEQNLQLFCLHRHGEVPIAIGMKVETKEGEGAEFIIYLPMKQKD